MSAPPVDLSKFRSDPSQQTYLGQICGSQQRFRDRYEVLQTLGRGGFGITFLAKDSLLPGQPLCVIKQLCPKVSDEAALQRARQRFKQEAETLSKLGSHAQIPQLLGYFEADGEFFLVQEYIRGYTLTQEVQQRGRFSEGTVKRFLREFLPLLQYVHSNRVIHRDIKPPNIIRCQDDGRLVLIDFGAVKEYIIQVGYSTCRPSTTQFVGTVGFAPPEQHASRPVYASDIYALGITCLYLLSGKSPLEFDYEFATGEVRWRDQIPVSDHFATILTKMIKTSSQDRYQSPQDILRALELEPYAENLAYCMNVKPKPFQSQPVPSVDISSQGYLSPLARKAIEIRNWQARLKARQLRRERMAPLMASHSGYYH